MDEISRALKTYRIDLVILNLTESPVKYNIIKEGNLFFSEETYKVIIELRILNEYFEFHNLLARYHLTKPSTMSESFHIW